MTILSFSCQVLIYRYNLKQTQNIDSRRGLWGPVWALVRVGLLLHSACPTQPAPIDPTENQGHTKTLVINQHGVDYCEDTVRWVCFCSHVPVLLSPSRQPLTELRSGQQLADLLWSGQQRVWPKALTHSPWRTGIAASTRTIAPTESAGEGPEWAHRTQLHQWYQRAISTNTASH